MKTLNKIKHNIFKFLPAFRGKLRLARLLIGREIHEQTFITNRGIKYSCPNLVETVSLELFVNGIYEKDTIAFISKTLPVNGVFVDVGGNIGAICIEVAIARPDITVYAFEASPKVFRYLIRNKLQNNVKNLFLFNLAIHEKDEIELPFYSPNYYNGQGSFTLLTSQTPEIVKTMRLEKFFDKYSIFPDFIKIDVEGYELLVLRSLSNFLKTNKPVILFEFMALSEKAANFDLGSAQNFLLEYGYCLTSLTTNRNISTILSVGSDMIIAKNLNHSI